MSIFSTPIQTLSRLRDMLRPPWIRLVLAIALLVCAAFLYLFEEGGTTSGRLYTPATFEDIDGWEKADFGPSLAAFVRSCGRFSRLKDDDPVGPEGNAGTAGAWKQACVSAKTYSGNPRLFFESSFAPYIVQDPIEHEETGLFTGYYEPFLTGSRKQSGAFQFPLLERPDDLITVDLGAFRKDLKGRRIAGRMIAGRLQPYPERAEIDAGLLADQTDPIVWVNSGIDSFFLHIQGSGRVTLTDGSVIRLAYNGQNGQPYRAIGRDLIEMGAVPAQDMSMQAIRGWLEANPDQAQDVMNKNPSFVFFSEQTVDDPGLGPKGAAAVYLTPGYSLAVDRKHHALGVPVWLEGSAPSATGDDRSFQRLMIAQDTGGAIRGAVRGDVFWGSGPKAAQIAGAMKHAGTMIALLPSH